MKVESNIERSPSGRGENYPFQSMAIGDSFFVIGQATSIYGKKGVRKKASAIACAHIYGKKHGLKFSGRNVEGGIRIWRIA